MVNFYARWPQLWPSRKISDGETAPLNPLPKTMEESKPNDLSNEPQNSSNSKQQWTNSREFLLSCVAMSVGLGNVWRFPYTAYENGGGAFLLPYVIVLIFIGRPVYFLELTLGQFSSRGATTVWIEMLPLFRGIGFGQIIGCFYIATYYSSLIALAIFYFFASYTEVLPWTVCNPDIDIGEKQICRTTIDFKTSFLNASIKSNNTQSNLRFISPAEQYFRYEVLKAKSSIDDGIGTPDVRLVGCLFLCYVFLFLSMWKGITSSGKVNPNLIFNGK